MGFRCRSNLFVIHQYFDSPFCLAPIELNFMPLESQNLFVTWIDGYIAKYFDGDAMITLHISSQCCHIQYPVIARLVSMSRQVMF